MYLDCTANNLSINWFGMDLLDSLAHSCCITFVFPIGTLWQARSSASTSTRPPFSRRLRSALRAFMIMEIVKSPETGGGFPMPWLFSSGNMLSASDMYMPTRMLDGSCVFCSATAVSGVGSGVSAFFSCTMFLLLKPHDISPFLLLVYEKKMHSLFARSHYKRTRRLRWNLILPSPETTLGSRNPGVAKSDRPNVRFSNESLLCAL